jgi:sulfofructose kinase
MARRFEARPRHARRVLCVGSITQDHIYRLESRLVVGTKHRTTSRDDIGGGVAANAAVTIARLGGRATLLGALGPDPVGDLVLEELRSERVEVEHIQRLAARSTPESIIVVEPSGDRTIIADSTIDLARLPAPNLPDATFDAVLVDARWSEATRSALDMARRAGIPGVVDVDRLPAETDLLDAASHLVFSESALAEFTATDDLGAGLRAVAGTSTAQMSVTAGERGVWWLDDGTVRHLDAFEVETVDTTGAGDVFHGACALALAEGAAEADAFRFASATAALKCSRPGARAGIPNRSDVDRLLTVTPRVPS